MIYATYIGKNETYKTEFKTFKNGKREIITAREYGILKNCTGFQFEGEGVDEKLEEQKELSKQNRKNSIDELQKEKEAIDQKVAAAKKVGKSDKVNLKKLKEAQKRIKTLLNKK
jgi:hypothetical protein